MWALRNSDEIARVYGFTLEQNQILIKYYEFGTLADLAFGNKPDYMYTAELAIVLAGQVASGLGMLHASEVTHNDLAITSILLELTGDSLKAKISGFEFASQLIGGQSVVKGPNVNSVHLMY